MLKMKDTSEKFYTKKENIFDLPFRVLIIGKSQLSGKTNVVGNLLLRDQYYKHDFEGDNIFIVSPSATTDHKLKQLIKAKEIPSSNVLPSYDEDLLMGLYDLLQEEFEEAVAEKRRPENKLIVFDDMSFGGALKSRQHGAIAKLFCNGRHLNISTLVTSQKYTDVLTTCRENATGCILFSSTDKQMEHILEDHNYLSNKNDFRRMFRKVTERPHSFLVVDYTSPGKSDKPCKTPKMYRDSEFKQVCMCQSTKEGD